MPRTRSTATLGPANRQGTAVETSQDSTTVRDSQFVDPGGLRQPQVAETDYENVSGPRSEGDLPPEQRNYPLLNPSQVNLREIVEAAVGAAVGATRRATDGEPKPDFELPPPTTFYGKSIREYQIFVSDLELRFKEQASRYPTEGAKIAYATSYLGENVKQSWNISQKEMAQEPTWEELNRYLHSYVEPESDRCQQAAYRLLNDRQGNRKFRDWGSRCMEIWEYFDNPAFRIQLFIETANKEIQKEFARAPKAPHSLADAIEQGTRYENILSREKSRRSRREAATHRNVGGPIRTPSQQPSTKQKREDERVETRPPGNRSSTGSSPPKYR